MLIEFTAEKGMCLSWDMACIEVVTSYYMKQSIWLGHLLQNYENLCSL